MIADWFPRALTAAVTFFAPTVDDRRQVSFNSAPMLAALTLLGLSDGKASIFDLPATFLRSPVGLGLLLLDDSLARLFL
jgi:hypothetical protein